MKIVKIEWCDKLFGVEIKTAYMHFVISANPSQQMTWSEAIRFYKNKKIWQLPTREHLLVVSKFIEEINDLMSKNGGYELRGWLWTVDEYDAYDAWLVAAGGYAKNSNKRNNDHVRAIHVFN